jgi:hypothetical protein
MITTDTIISSPNGKANARNSSHTQQLNDRKNEWSNFQKIIFRFAFLYFFFQAFPLDWKFYARLFSIDWTSVHLKDLFDLSRYAPSLTGSSAGFADWGIIALAALAGTLIWSLQSEKEKNYESLYYYLRVLLRYRLAAGALAFGFVKFFPMQMPYPSLSSLHTRYGDLSTWRIFSMSTGIVPDYQSFLGGVEIFAALLLLYRKTASIGAFILFTFIANAFISNLAYEGGEVVYSLHLVIIAFFVFAYDLPRLISLTTFERLTDPVSYKPVYDNWKQNLRLALKTSFVAFFIILYGYKSYGAYKNSEYQFPKEPGLKEASGFYNVSLFRINNDTIPYSPADSERWRDVVFEKWSSVSIRSGKPVLVYRANTEEIFLKDEDKNYEYVNTQGRHYYDYKVDSTEHVLILENRNPDHSSEKLILHYSRPDSSRIILSGINENKDSVYAELERVNKKYLLHEAAKTGRRKSLKL